MSAEELKHVDGWTPDLSVGVDIIDDDHQAFFRLADLLRDVLDNPDENTDFLVETSINILLEYVEGHFLREEMAMAAVGYPLMAEHVTAHEVFSARAYQIAQDYRGGNKDVAASISNLVAKWITGHIKTMDMQYLGILSNENVDDRPLIYLTGSNDDMESGDSVL